MHERLPVLVQPLLDHYLAEVQRALSDLITSFYVVGLRRQFYSFCDGAITTKERAGADALTCLPVERHLMIWEALRIRTAGWSPACRSRPARAADTVRLLKSIIQRY